MKAKVYRPIRCPAQIAGFLALKVISGQLNKARQTDPPRDGYRYKVTLRNDGQKTIKSIDWDYLFLDPVTQQEVSHHQFTSDDTIKPGKSKEISVLYLNPPVKIVNVRKPGNKGESLYKEQVLLARIQYSDGSVWQHP